MNSPDEKLHAQRLQELTELRRQVADMAEREAALQAKERQLREEARRFDLFMKHVPGAAFIDTSDGDVVFLNETARRNLGLDPAQPLHVRLDALFPAELAERIREEDRAVIASGQAQVFEKVLPGSEGPRHWRTCKFPIPQENGPPLVGGVAIDITRVQQSETRLRQSEELFRSFFDSSVSGMVMLSLEGKVLDVNPALCRFFGYSKEELQEKGFLCLTHPEEVEASRKFYGEVRAGLRDCADHERRFLHRDGSVLWGHVRGGWLRDGHGGQLCWISLVEDITARKRTEEALRLALAEAQEARDRIDNIIESVMDGLLVTDRHRRVILMNGAAGSLLNRPLSEALNRDVLEVLKGAGLEEPFAHLLNQSVATGAQSDLEVTLPGMKSPRIIQLRRAPMRDSKGQQTGMVTILHDVTADREMDRLKSEFISTAAHELRTPLASVMGYTELLLDPAEYGGFSAEQKRDFLWEIYEKGETLSRIIDDLLDLSRIDAGREIPLAKEACDPGQIVEKVTRRFQMLAPRHRFVLALEANRGSVVPLDRHRIIQVLENLFSNAVKYSPKGGEIRVAGRLQDGRYHLAVSDEGIGMTPEQLLRAFDKFYRADASDTAAGGLGLGLGIVRQIVHAHGGEIRLESAPGEGTTVFLTLPVGP